MSGPGILRRRPRFHQGMVGRAPRTFGRLRHFTRERRQWECCPEFCRELRDGQPYSVDARRPNPHNVNALGKVSVREFAYVSQVLCEWGQVCVISPERNVFPSDQRRI